LNDVQKALPLLNDGGSIILKGSGRGCQRHARIGVYGENKARSAIQYEAWTESS